MYNFLNKSIDDYEDDNIDHGNNPIDELNVWDISGEIHMRITMGANFYDYIGKDLISGCPNCRYFEMADKYCEYDEINDCRASWGIHQELEWSILAIIDDIHTENKSFDILLEIKDMALHIEIYPILHGEDDVPELTGGKYAFEAYTSMGELWLPAIKKEFIPRNKKLTRR